MTVAMTMCAIERAEVQAWIDMYAAIPPEHRERYDPEILQVEWTRGC